MPALGHRGCLRLSERPIRTKGAFSPDVYEARVLVDSYFRYFAWQYVENCPDDCLHQF
jgi:hypothetical protein